MSLSGRFSAISMVPSRAGDDSALVFPVVGEVAFPLQEVKRVVLVISSINNNFLFTLNNISPPPIS